MWSGRVKELKGFKKLMLAPGEKQKVIFILGFDELKMLDAGLNPVVGPGDIEIMIGVPSDDIRLRETLEVR